ncbi:MAG TPA: SLC13 family permease [Allosphingosinicella sp.]|nr:SLC13 family permease [Allosphingosinicella sp.]
MTGPQITTFAVLGGTMLLFIWGRLRYDLVAVLALLAALATGIVAPDEAFSGFSDEIVIIVGSALVVSAAIERSGLVEALVVRATQGMKRLGGQVLVLAGSVALLSALVKNIGALAMLMPSALNLARRTHGQPSRLLMPMAFASLLGGLITLIGTSPNIIVSRVREEMMGEPFGMFDYAPVGLGLTLVGLLFLSVGHRLLPGGRRATPTLGEALDIKDYSTEARVTGGAPADGETIAAFRRRTNKEVEVTGLLRGAKRKSVPLARARLEAGDLLILEGEPEALERVITTSGLELEGQHREAARENGADIGVIEAVVEANSVLAGTAARRATLHENYGVNLLAVSRRGERLTRRPRDIILLPGDVIVLQGPLDSLPERLTELGCLPLAERPLRLGSTRRRLIPLAILAAAMTATAAGLVPVAVAFFAAAGLIMLSGALPPREAYDHIEWPILIMIGALIPVSDALRTTGGTDLIAAWLSAAAAGLPAWGAVALIMVAAMAVTPFLNNAATVLVMAPIAAEFAGGLGYRPEAFLMATAVGAGCDFLTPIGHQCNTLVMGPGGYRFGDYARLGAPLSLIVVLVGVPLILAVWPLRG